MFLLALEQAARLWYRLPPQAGNSDRGGDGGPVLADAARLMLGVLGGYAQSAA